MRLQIPAKLKEPRTNWKYVLIVMILAFFVSGGILGYKRWTMRKVIPFTQFPEIKRPEKVVEYGTVDWKTYRNEEYEFEIKYPKDIEVIEVSPYTKRQEKVLLIELPSIDPSVESKKAEIITWRYPPRGETCSMETLLNKAHSVYKIQERETMYVGDTKFYKEIEKQGEERYAFEAISYSTITKEEQWENSCVVLRFSFTLINFKVFEIPPQPFDREKEIDIFNKMLSSFRLLK